MPAGALPSALSALGLPLLPASSEAPQLLIGVGLPATGPPGGLSLDDLTAAYDLLSAWRLVAAVGGEWRGGIEALPAPSRAPRLACTLLPSPLPSAAGRALALAGLGGGGRGSTAPRPGRGPLQRGGTGGGGAEGASSISSLSDV